MSAGKSVGIAVIALLLAGSGYAGYARYTAGTFAVAANGTPVRTGRAVSTEQKLCAEMGKMLFEGSGYATPDPPEFTAVHTAYYNARLGHCYLAITSTYTETKATLVELFDADDKKLYGQYNLAPTGSVDAPGAPTIVGCAMQAANGTETTCTTPAEWTAFITGFMN